MPGTMGAKPKALLSVTAAAEAGTGLALLAAPSAVVELLLGATPGTPAGMAVSRVAGVALVALGVACWLAREDAVGRVAKGLVTAILFYNLGVVVIFVLARTGAGLSGIAFWPVVLAHAGLAAWCVADLSKGAPAAKRP